MDNEILSVADVAAIYGVGVTCVRRWCTDGLLKASRLGSAGRVWTIRREALEGFVRPKNGRPFKLQG